MTTFSPLYLSAFLPDAIYFKTLQSNQGWVLIRDVSTMYRLHADAPFYNQMIRPACFPFSWLRNSPSSRITTARIPIYMSEIISVLRNSDIQLNRDVHSDSYLQLISQVLALNLPQSSLIDALAQDCRDLLEDIKKSGNLGRIASTVRASSKKGLTAQYLNINILLQDAVEFPSLKCTPSLKMNIQIHPFKANAISVRVIQDPVVLFNNPLLVSNVIDQFKSELRLKGYDVE